MNSNETSIIVAGGCFWGVEELIRKEPGVLSTEVGYCGGDTPNPTYETVRLGHSGHAESIKITFDSSLTDYKKLFRFFFSIHDPTTLNQQGNDRGSQYRSAIFFQTERERQAAEKIIAEVNASDFWKAPVVTQLEPLKAFYSAEKYHQAYLQKNPGGYTCHFKRY